MMNRLLEGKTRGKITRQGKDWKLAGATSRNSTTFQHLPPPSTTFQDLPYTFREATFETVEAGLRASKPPNSSRLLMMVAFRSGYVFQ